MNTNTTEETRHDRGFEAAMETLSQYRNLRWTIEGLLISFDDDGETSLWDDDIRAEAMFAFGRLIDPEAYDILDLSTFSGELGEGDVIQEGADGSETGHETIVDNMTSQEHAIIWLLCNLKERTSDMVFQAMGQWGASKAVGGDFHLQVLHDMAKDVAENFESHLLRDLPGTEAAIREDLAQLLLAKACAKAAGRPDLEGSYDELLLSYYYGNPVLGIGKDGQLIVVSE